MRQVVFWQALQVTSRVTWQSLANRSASWCCWRGVSRHERVCSIRRALYRGSVARPRRWCSSCPVRLRHSSRASPARRTTWKGSMTALAPGSSSAAALLNPVNPSIATISMRLRHVSGWEASQVLKTCLERPGIMSRSREGPRRSRIGVKSKMTVTYLSPYGVWRLTCSSTPMTHTPSKRSGSSMSMRWPSPKIAALAALPGHAQSRPQHLHPQMRRASMMGTLPRQAQCDQRRPHRTHMNN